MSILPIPDDPDRYALSNELHARPFPELTAPSSAFCIAIRTTTDADRDAQRAQLVALLDRFGAQHPPDHANHYFSALGRNRVKWERHTEFETYTIFVDGAPERSFTPDDTLFPSDWLENVQGNVISAVLVQVETLVGAADLDQGFADRAGLEFVPESLSVAKVLDSSALVASDFRIDENGVTRFLVQTPHGIGSRRLGRITQRLIEVETYKAMSMLALPNARKVSARLSIIDQELAEIVASYAEKTRVDSQSLDRLIAISAELEDLAAHNDSRFSAARAYSTIVRQRIDVLREERVGGRQTLAEFMTRRFDPAMRTCEATAARLTAMATRANRAAQLLRAQADVARENQNQQILTRMDERAAQQLKLQKTVEGLSVVAISYYAVNLATNIAMPFAEPLGISKLIVAGVLTPFVIFFVWFMLHRIKKTF